MSLGLVPSFAQIQNLESGLGNSYNYADHFDIVINKPVDEVWPHVINMSTWMSWMANKNTETSEVLEGDKINLYGDFYIEVAKVIPKKMILLVNPPAIERGEQTQGIAMVSIVEHDGKTLVL